MSSNTKFGLAYGLCALLLCGCTNRDEYSDREQSGGQKLLLTASIQGADNDRSKAPIDGVAFADGTHQFGLSLTEEDRVTAYEAGSESISASAVVAGATQSWSYSWASNARTDLPLLYGGTPILVAAYYPYSDLAGSVADRDNGRFNAPFDLSTTIEQSNQTDVLYSTQLVGYNIGGSKERTVALSFRHLYALVDLQIKLKDDKKEATIIQVEVCNKEKKTFLSNKGFFSPYTGQLTAPTPGDVSVETSTALNVDSYATIRLMVPPTLFQGYADGDILVKVYGSDDPTPKWFPILREYLAPPDNEAFMGNGFTGGGRYTYRVLYHTSEFSSLTEVVGWRTSTPGNEDVGGGDISGILSIPTWGNGTVTEEMIGTGEVHPPKASEYVVIEGVRWAKGNLVAKNENACQVGLPTDNGLYFQFGSLVGWTGGANGNGVGVGSPTLDKAVWPSELNVAKPSYDWPSKDANNVDALSDRYFNYSKAPWNANNASSDIGTFAVAMPGQAAAAGELCNGHYAHLGVGDPCAYYLGDPWRMPTAVDYLTLIGKDGANTDKQIPLKLNNYDLSFPASGHRLKSDGTLESAPTKSSYWSNSTYSATNGYALSVSASAVNPQDNTERSYGLPVRCVNTTFAFSSSAPAEAGYIETTVAITIKGTAGLTYSVTKKSGDEAINLDESTATGTIPANGQATVSVVVGRQDNGAEAREAVFTVSCTTERSEVLDVDYTIKQAAYPPLFIEVNGLRWATGNLVASDNNSCRIGAPTDHGLYFQFGSLVGWTGGANGNGEGVTNASLPLNQVVWPTEMGDDKPTYVWQDKNGAGVDTLSHYYFNYSKAPWDAATSTDIGAFADSLFLQGSNAGNLRSGRYANLGVGDPCTHYLGSPWRTPTSDEMAALNAAGSGSWTTPYAGRWFGTNTGADSRLFFPAAGDRTSGNVKSFNVNLACTYWSSSAHTALRGYNLAADSGKVLPQNALFRSFGLPVRCVGSVE